MEILLVLGGVAVSLIMELVKKYIGVSRIITLATVLVLSLIGGVGFWALKQYNLWESFLQIASSAALVYAFIIKNIEEVMAGNRIL